MAISIPTVLPLPEQKEENSVSECRLWIGNLDLRITEYVLLKLVQKFGKPDRYDFMYHITGPDKGKPKGYCFVTYPTKEMAEKAIRGLNGKLALSRRLAVHWARDKYQPDPVQSTSSSLTESKSEETTCAVPSQESTESKIRAIEAKLSAMQEGQKDFGISEMPAAPPGTSRYSSVNTKKPTTTNNSRGSFRRRPYIPNNHHRGRGRRR